MTTSPRTFSLPRPDGDTRVERSTLAYFQGRNRGRLYDLIIDQLEKSGLSQAQVARRLGKGTDQVCRWLGAPGNWTLDTVSDLIFAITGGEIAYSLSFPLSLPVRNHSKPEWAEVPVYNVTHTPTVIDPYSNLSTGTSQRFLINSDQSRPNG